MSLNDNAESNDFDVFFDEQYPFDEYDQIYWNTRCIAHASWMESKKRNQPRWLPIDKAAKDGSTVDLWVVDGDQSYRVCNAYFNGDEWSDEYDYLLLGRPTHYMPIPDVPEKL